VKLFEQCGGRLNLRSPSTELVFIRDLNRADSAQACPEPAEGASAYFAQAELDRPFRR